MNAHSRINGIEREFTFMELVDDDGSNKARSSMLVDNFHLSKVERPSEICKHYKIFYYGILKQKQKKGVRCKSYEPTRIYFKTKESKGCRTDSDFLSLVLALIIIYKTMSYLFVLKEEIVLKLQSYKDNSIELC
jgi:hypothetical protein